MDVYYLGYKHYKFISLLALNAEAQYAISLIQNSIKIGKLFQNLKGGRIHTDNKMIMMTSWA